MPEVRPAAPYGLRPLAPGEADLWTQVQHGVFAPESHQTYEGIYGTGEYVALHAAGRIDEATLLELSEARGRAIIEAAGEDLGTMAALDAPAEKIEALLDDGTITIANRNAPHQTIISGSKSAIEGALVRLKEAGVTGRAIPVACAFHSPLVAPARDRLAETLRWCGFGDQPLSRTV